MTRSCESPIPSRVIEERLHIIRQRMETAAKRAGRDPTRIRLVAVSKAKTPSAVREAFVAGQRLFGESYVQELKAKSAACTDLAIEWHFIGHLQRNKVGLTTPLISWIHSLDSLALAETLNRRTTHPLNVLIEVNVGGETTKTGVDPDDVGGLAKAVSRLDRLKLRGLMCIPPFDANPESSRPAFRQLRTLREKVRRELHLDLPELSMGMSHDFEVAIEEGATMVRIGTAIFGERPEKI